MLSLSSVPAQDLDIYTDQLRNGFEDWGWASHSLSNASPVHAGAYSIAISAGPWAGLYLHHKAMDTRGYTNLAFWAYGEDGGQILRVGSKIGTNDQANYSFPPLPPNQWTRLQVPLRVLEAADTSNFCGFLIQLRDNCPTNTFYLDEIKLEAVRAESSAALPGKDALSEQRPSSPVVPPQPNPTANLSLWIAGGVGTSIALLVWLVVAVRRNARTAVSSRIAASSAALSPAAAIGDGTFEFVSAEDWRQRAVTAEAVASKQAKILRENLMPELAEFAKERVVQGLSAQRIALLETQRRAQQELADLEGRLAALHLPLRERILVYESRITELEKELSTRGEEMRELIRATLSLVRARLEEEKRNEALGNSSRNR